MSEPWVQVVAWLAVALVFFEIVRRTERDEEEERDTMGTKCDFCAQVIYYKPWEHIRRCFKSSLKRESARKKLTYEERRLAHRRAEGYES